MADLFNSSMKKNNILERVGDISQICDARSMMFTDGKRAGVEAIDITTGSGFAFTVLPSRGFDISNASFKGIPIAWKSCCGETAPSYHEPEGYGWLRSFFGGLLTTCGMTYSAHPCEDEGERLGLHGRVSNIPAENVTVSKKWDGDDYNITVSGSVREAVAFGNKLELSRSITTSLGSSKLIIHDTIENLGFTESPLMMLYHINIGWPIVSENSQLVSPTAGVKPADDRAREEINGWKTFLSPQSGYQERVYFHDQKADENGTINVALINESRDIAVYLSYTKDDFPHFVEWKMMNQGEYVVGIEPGNITGHRAHMREEGTLEFIKPGAQRSFKLEIGILEGRASLQAMKNKINEVAL